MAATVIQIDQADVKFGAAPVAPDDPNDPYDVDPADLTDYSCQVTRAEITSTANTTETTVPPTFCQPESRLSVPVASTFVLNLDILQDWTVAAGLSAWLFKNDATTKAFALYLEGTANPVAKGLIVVTAGGFGGTPGQPLVATVTLNIQGYPVILDSAGASLRPAPVVGTTETATATGTTTGTPTGAGSTPTTSGTTTETAPAA